MSLLKNIFEIPEKLPESYSRYPFRIGNGEAPQLIVGGLVFPCKAERSFTYNTPVGPRVLTAHPELSYTGMLPGPDGQLDECKVIPVTGRPLPPNQNLMSPIHKKYCGDIDCLYFLALPAGRFDIEDYQEEAYFASLSGQVLKPSTTQDDDGSEVAATRRVAPRYLFLSEKGIAAVFLYYDKDWHDEQYMFSCQVSYGETELSAEGLFFRQDPITATISENTFYFTTDQNHLFYKGRRYISDDGKQTGKHTELLYVRLTD